MCMYGYIHVYVCMYGLTAPIRIDCYHYICHTLINNQHREALDEIPSFHHFRLNDLFSIPNSRVVTRGLLRPVLCYNMFHQHNY
jgi:hypothetical protein